MSTRAIYRFIQNGQIEASVYVHNIVDAESGAMDMFQFLNEVKNLSDSRLSDPNLLASRFVVYEAKDWQNSIKRMGGDKNPHCLDFLGVYLTKSDSGDVDYFYHVNCDKIGKDGIPEVLCFSGVKRVSVASAKNKWKIRAQKRQAKMDEIDGILSTVK